MSTILFCSKISCYKNKLDSASSIQATSLQVSSMRGQALRLQWVMLLNSVKILIVV